MTRFIIFALALPLLAGAQDYPWLSDPNWKPAGGWGTPAGGWGSVDYSGGSNSGSGSGSGTGEKAAANPAVPGTPVAPAPSPSTPAPTTPTTIATSVVAAPPSTTSSTSSTTSSPPPTVSTTAPSSGGGGSTSSCPDGQQSIEMQNNSGQDLHILASPPWTVGNCAVISSGSSCTLCQDRGATGGNIQLGYGQPNPRGTWLEGNWDTNAQFPCMDVSYIPGYSVPITCTGSDGTSTIGMSDPLCADEQCSNCASGGGTYQNGACLNPMGAPETVLVNGPAPDFFSSATGIVYTYPNDSHDGYAPAWDSATCIAHPQSGSSSSKREVAQEEAQAPASKEKRAEHLKRHHRHALRHGAIGGASF